MTFSIKDTILEYMKKAQIKELFVSMKAANQRISELSSKDKSELEKTLDVEHAYYSSTLEGSQLDRKDFDRLAKEAT